MFGQLLKQAAGIEQPQEAPMMQYPQFQQFQGMLPQMQQGQMPQRLDMFGQSNQFGGLLNYNRFR